MNSTTTNRRSNATDSNETQSPKNATDPSFQLAAITTFVAVNLVAPFLVGEVFPFTISPMFRDEPQKYSVYEVTDEDGRMLPVQNYGLQLEYDGNPPGMGVGILPRVTINEFGEVASESVVREHVQKRLAESSRDVVIVKQIVIGAIDDQHVGQIEGESQQWKIRKN